MNFAEKQLESSLRVNSADNLKQKCITIQCLEQFVKRFTTDVDSSSLYVI